MWGAVFTQGVNTPFLTHALGNWQSQEEDKQKGAGRCRKVSPRLREDKPQAKADKVLPSQA